jgi:hypothetical protein
MRKVLLLLVGTAVLWLPAVSIAGDSSKPASAKAENAAAPSRASNLARICKSQRNDPVFGSSHRGQTFAQFYGTNRGKGRGTGRNAFGKCVSRLASHEAEQGKAAGKEGKDESESRDQDSGKNDRQDTGAGSHRRSAANPAMTCKALWANDRAHFQTAYGTRPNAFGKCVSSHATGEDG